jgi:hypothetical protein
VLIIIFALYSFRDRNLYPDHDEDTNAVDIENEIAMTEHPISKKDREKMFERRKNKRVVYLKEQKRTNSNNNEDSSSDDSNDDNNSFSDHSEKVFIISKRKNSRRNTSEKNNQTKINNVNNQFGKQLYVTALAALCRCTGSVAPLHHISY